MDYNVKRAASAEADLEGIYSYITFRLNNPKAAADLANQYEKRIITLQESPRLYGLSQNPELARRGYRYFTFGNYIAYYTIDEANHIVNIARIFYQKQNYGETL